MWTELAVCRETDHFPLGPPTRILPLELAIVVVLAVEEIVEAGVVVAVTMTVDEEGEEDIMMTGTDSAKGAVRMIVVVHGFVEETTVMTVTELIDIRRRQIDFLLESRGMTVRT